MSIYNQNNNYLIEFKLKRYEIDRYYYNFVQQNLNPLKKSTENEILDIYNILYNKMINEKEQKINNLKDKYNILFEIIFF